jgi:chromosome segregation ATPase
MNELRELESGIERLKRDSQAKRTMIDALEREKTELLRRSDELSDRLGKINEAYRESFSRLTNSVNSQVNELRGEIAGLSNSLKGLSGLEQRLESQERSHEKSLNRLEKELALVEKSLSDVERVKSELSQQKAFFQEAKLQLEKSLQAGVAYVRKEMELNRREDAKAALEEFKQELGRITSLEKELNAYKRSQGERLDSLVGELSSVRSAMAELKAIRERSSSLEGLARGLEEKFAGLSARQKTAVSTITSELSKQMERSIASLRKELESRRSEDAKAALEEFKQELGRISSLEQTLRAQEGRLDRLSKELSGLQPKAEQIALLREKIDENLHMNQSLADKTVSKSDFEQAMKSASKRADELDSMLFSLNKRLSTDKGRLEKSILEVLNEEKLLEGTQENIRKWFDAKSQDMEKRVSSGLDALTTQMEEGQALVDRLSQRSQRLDFLSREAPKRLEEHSKAISGLLDARTGLATSMESLSGDIKEVSGRLSSSLERISSLEKSVSSSDKSRETRLDSLAKELSGYQEFQAGLSTKLASSLERLSSLEKSLSALDKSNETRLDDFAGSISGYQEELSGLSERLSSSLERISSLEKGMSSMDKSRETMIGRLSRDMASLQQELMGQGMMFKEVSDSSRLDMANLRNELNASLKAMKKELDARVRDATESGLNELKEKTRGLASMKDLESEVKLLKSAMGQMARAKDFISEVESIKAGLSALESRTDAFAGGLAGELKELRKSMDSQLSGLSEEQSSQFKKEYDYISKNIATIRDLSSDIKVFRARLDELDRLSKSRLSEQDFRQFKEYIESRLSDSEGISRKSLAELSKELEEFRGKVESGRLSNEEFSKAMELVDARLEDLGVLAKSSSNELRRDLNALGKSVTERFNELRGSQTGELKDELKRISHIEEDLDTYSKTHEERIDQLSEDLSSLQAMPTEIGMLREKIESLEEMSGSVVYGREFSQKTGEINSTLDHLQKGLAGLDKRLHSQSADLDAAIQEALSEDRLLKKSQDGMNRLVDARIAGLDRKLSGNLKELSEGLAQNSALIHQLQEGLSGMESLSGQSARSMESLDSLRERLERLEAESRSVMSSLTPEVKSISDSISSFQERLTSLEKGFASEGGSRMKRIGELSNAIKAMDAKLESGRGEIEEFKEYMTGHVNEIINAYEKRFGELSKSISSKQAGTLERNLSELENLKAKVSEIDILAKALSEKSVPESEFIETIKAVSKRIDDMENLYSDIDKKTSVHESQLDRAVENALSDDRLIQSSQKHMREWLESRMTEIESRLSGEAASHASQLTESLKEISSIREEIARLSTLSEHLDKESMTRLGERLDSVTESREGMDKKIDSLMGELKSMNDRLIEEKGRINTLEQRLSSSLGAQQTKFREMLREQKTDVDTEISEEAARIMKDAEVGELKRREEFENMLRRFQELHIKTQQSLDATSKQGEALAAMEKRLKGNIDKHAASAQSRLSSGYERLKVRLNDAENLMMKLNNMISELQLRLEKSKTAETDFNNALAGIREELEERLRADEEMFDSEMNAFKSVADSLTNELKRLKDIQKDAARPSIDSKHIELLNKSVESIGMQLQTNRDEIKKFEEYITGYINNLVNTYEKRMGTIKKEMDHKLNNVKIIS